uniref:Uncharacterized protein n=1 Tax=Anguilla anguilla TaxID=7936 RepID=A0A0E9REP2_ANGAN
MTIASSMVMIDLQLMIVLLHERKYHLKKSFLSQKAVFIKVDKVWLSVGTALH